MLLFIKDNLYIYRIKLIYDLIFVFWKYNFIDRILYIFFCFRYNVLVLFLFFFNLEKVLWENEINYIIDVNYFY